MPTTRWFDVKSRDRGRADRAAAVWGIIDRLKAARVTEAMLDRIHEAIYLGRPIAAGNGRAASAQLLTMSRSAPALINIAQSKCDAVTSRLAKRRPFPVISADDSSWTERRFARRASRVQRSRMGRTDIERMTPNVLRDAVIRGTGATKVYSNGGDVAFDRVPRHELLVDPFEARYGTPRQMFQVKAYPVEVLQAAYPDKNDRQAIEAAISRDTDDWVFRQEYGLDVQDSAHVLVGEAWHLPSGPDAKDGAHDIVIRGRVLHTEEWTRPRFPFAFCHWQPPITGFWGRGLVETLAGPQAKINDLARDIQEALFYASQLVIFTPRSSNINKEHLRGRHPRVVEYDGALPHYEAPLPVSPQIFQFLDWLINICDDISGLSRDYQSGNTSLGAGASGKAMDTHYDIQSDRFALTELGYALYRVDMGALMIDAARDIAEEGGKHVAPWIKDLPWRKVDIDDGNYHLKLEPINFLPDSRAGKLSTLKEMAEAGMIKDPMMILDLFDEPDLAAAFRIELGPIHAIQALLEGLDAPEIPLLDIMPDSHFRLDLTMSFLKGAYNEAISGRADDQILERYRYAMKWTKRLQDQAELGSPSAAPPGGPAAPPGGMPLDAGAAAAGGMLPPGAAPPPMATPIAA